ncbi:MAG: CAAX prenyl protease-related protein [Tepidisphaeraceae bacterium]
MTASPDINHPRVQNWHYWLPMAVFLGIIFLNQYAGLPFPVAYVARTVVVAVILICVWRFYTRVRWNYWQLGLLVGVLGLVQWVGMEMGLIWLRDQFAEGSTIRSLIGLTSMVKPEDSMVYVVPNEIHNPWLLWGFIAVRWTGSTLVVPFMEETFWRDWLWRTVAAPNDFRLQRVGEYDKFSVWLVPVFFALVHVQLLTAVVWALMIAWLLLRTKSIGACIVAHATTNFLLGGWVLLCWQMGWKPLGHAQWFFW